MTTHYVTFILNNLLINPIIPMQRLIRQNVTDFDCEKVVLTHYLSTRKYRSIFNRVAQIVFVSL